MLLWSLNYFSFFCSFFSIIVNIKIYSCLNFHLHLFKLNYLNLQKGDIHPISFFLDDSLLISS